MDNSKLSKTKPKFNLKKFKKEVLNQINSLRDDPQGFAIKVESAITNLTPEKGAFIYHTPDKKKIMFKKGEVVFHNAAKLLRSLPSLSRLELNDGIALDLPNEDLLKSKDVSAFFPLRQMKQEQISQQYEGDLKLSRDIGTTDALTNVIFQIVDNNNEGRQKNLINPNIGYLGVNATLVDKRLYSFFTFI